MISDKKNNFTKKIIITMMSSICVGSICFIGINHAMNKEYILDVASTKITIEEFNQLLTAKKYFVGKQIGFDNIDKDGYQSEKQIKNELINAIAHDEILYQLSKNKNISVSENEINKEFESYKAFIEDDIDFDKQYEIDDKVIKKFIEKDIYSKKYIDKIISKIEVSEEEINNYYNNNKNKLFNIQEVNASHILFKTYNENKKEFSDDKKNKILNSANEVLVRIKNGENFETLAKKYSEDEGTSSNGGNLGYFGKDVMIDKFDEIVFNMKKNEISEVFETSYGYHIVKINDIRNTELELKNVKDIIINNIKVEKAKDIILELVSNYPIRVYRK